MEPEPLGSLRTKVGRLAPGQPAYQDRDREIARAVNGHGPDHVFAETGVLRGSEQSRGERDALRVAGVPQPEQGAIGEVGGEMEAGDVHAHEARAVKPE